MQIKMDSKLILRPEFISSASLYLSLKESGFFGSHQVYVISPADLDFVQVDPTMRKYASNAIKHLRAKSGSFLILDGVMLHSKLDLRQYPGLQILFFDTLGLPVEYLGMFKPENVRYLKLKTPEVLYKAIKDTTPEAFIAATSEYRHVIFGSGLGNMDQSFDEFKQEITNFNKAEDNIPLYIEFMPPRHIENCDYLHVMADINPWDVEFLISMIYKSTYTSKDLRVIFYIKDTELSRKKYEALSQHLNMHLGYEDDLLNNELYQPLILHNGTFESF
jgi:hypothetical protein